MDGKETLTRLLVHPQVTFEIGEHLRRVVAWVAQLERERGENLQKFDLASSAAALACNQLGDALRERGEAKALADSWAARCVLINADLAALRAQPCGPHEATVAMVEAAIALWRWGGGPLKVGYVDAIYAAMERARCARVADASQQGDELNEHGWPHADAKGKVAARLQQLAAMPEDWDSYKAARITPEAVAAVLAFLDGVSIVPMVTGGLGIEIHAAGLEVEYEFGPDGGLSDAYAEIVSITGQPQPTAAEPEGRWTQQRVSDWANATFGPVGSNARVAARANEEMAELLRALTADDNHPKAANEIADIVIVLYRLAWRLGVDLLDEIDRKMAVNSTREWKLDKTGHGYHVRLPAPPETRET